MLYMSDEALDVDRLLNKWLKSFTGDADTGE